jgi:hypothetical protein
VLELLERRKEAEEAKRKLSLVVINDMEEHD